MCFRRFAGGFAPFLAVWGGQPKREASLLAVYPVVDRDKTHIVPSEYLHRVAYLEIVAPPAGKVFHNADTDFPVFHIVHHAGVGGTVKKPDAFVIVDVVPDVCCCFRRRPCPRRLRKGGSKTLHTNFYCMWHTPDSESVLPARNMVHSNSRTNPLLNISGTHPPAPLCPVQHLRSVFRCNTN